MKKYIFFAFKTLACVAGLAYTVLLAYGLWNLSFITMLPWLSLGTSFVSLVFAVQSAKATKELERQVEDMFGPPSRLRRSA